MLTHRSHFDREAYYPEHNEGNERFPPRKPKLQNFALPVSNKSHNRPFLHPVTSVSY